MLLRHAGWARRVAGPLLTGYTLLAGSVTAMALVMNIDNDPDAAPALAVGFGGFTAVLVVLTWLLYRPLFDGVRGRGRGPGHRQGRPAVRA